MQVGPTAARKQMRVSVVTEGDILRKKENVNDGGRPQLGGV